MRFPFPNTPLSVSVKTRGENSARKRMVPAV
jgi:hypothetical protein